MYSNLERWIIYRSNKTGDGAQVGGLTEKGCFLEIVSFRK